MIIVKTLYFWELKKSTLFIPLKRWRRTDDDDDDDDEGISEMSEVLMNF